ncbi:MAG: hypothetical protein RBU21_25530, partial [FCB group bacterium]|nr:hypothetical protein [FCB group bacterium]
ADDYYGPNEPLRADLSANGNTWKPIHRLARGNDLQIDVKTGALQRSYPPRIAADGEGNAVFDITGGAGYVPVTVTNLRTPRGHTVACDGKPVDQSRHGNDFWQTDYDAATGTWSQTYNVSLDTADDTPILRHFSLAARRAGE